MFDHHAMHPLNRTQYQPPILTGIFNVLGVLVLVGAVLFILYMLSAGVAAKEPAVLFPAIATAVVAVLASIVYFGIAQVIDFLGRTAHFTDRLSTTLETSVIPRLTSIEQRLSSGTPLVVRVDSSPAAPPLRTGRVGAVFHYTADGAQQGPFTPADMKDFRVAEVLADETPVFREGESQWRTYRDYPELTT